MPRIEKVRITGVRYDKMKKHFENTIFDFINEDYPQHALLTLVNGGGKGMLLQTIFQVLMPLTTWGKNGENHIDALFYNEKQQFDPYTFHVALEWRLDTDPVEWLVSGVCITARKNGQENEEVDTEPQYFLYTGKYRKPEDWTIDTLPLYDEQNEQTLSFEDWENWLKKHKQQFQIYSKSKQSAYYQYLSSYGIEKMEWKSMKEINRDEGGIEHYFKKGLDNFGLFHNLIIPEINSYLEEGQEGELIKIFRDNSIIAQKLPKLLKREEAYQLINEKLLPIKGSLEAGQELETKIQEHLDRANYLYFGMEEQKQTYLYDQEKWEEDRRITEKSQADFLWQKDNLEYAGECRKYEKISSEIETVQSQVQQLETALNTLKAEKLDLEVDIALTDYLDSNGKLKVIEDRLSFLENAQNLQEEKEQTSEIEQILAEKWVGIESEILGDIERFNTLKNNLQNERKSVKKQIELSQEDLNNVRSNLGTYTAFIKTHNQKAISMEQKYGRDINREPEAVQKRCMKELQELEETIKSLEQEILDLQDRKGEVSKLIGEIGAVIKGKNEELQHLQRKMEERLQAEKSFHKRWCQYYQEEQEFEIYSADDWIDVAGQLTQETEKVKTQFEHLQKDYWYHQLDTALVNDDYWVANNDVRKLVEKLGEAGVTASYGTQLIQEYSEEERDSLLEKYPLLAFGIVVHQHDWEKRVDHIVLQQLLVHSPVPIFIRERMNQDYALPFEIVRDKGISMAFHKEQWLLWKDKLAKLTDSYRSDIDMLADKHQEANALLDSINALQVKTFQEFLSEETTLKQQLNNYETKQRQLLDDEKLIGTQLKELRDSVKQHTHNQALGLKKLHEMEAWVNDYHQYLDYQKLKSEALVKEKEIENRLVELTKLFEEQEQNLARWKDSFTNWKIGMEHQTVQLKAILPDVEFPNSDTIHTNHDENPIFRKTIFDGVSQLIKDWEKLQQKIHSVSSELASEKTKKEYQLTDQQQKKNLLGQLDADWVNRNIAKLPKEIVQERLKGKVELIQQSDSEHRKVSGRVENLSGRLEQIEENKRRQEKQILGKHHTAADPWLDMNLEGKDVEIEKWLKKIKEDLDSQQKIIADLIYHQHQLQNQQKILGSHKTSFKQVGEIPQSFREKIKSEPEKLILGWIGQNNDLSGRKEQYHNVFKGQLKELSQVLENDKIDAPLKQSMNQLIPQLESDSNRSSFSVITSVIEHIQNELLKLKEDKEKAENAQEIWVDRAVIRVIRIFQSLKQMVNRMKVNNQEGHYFPLVQIDGLKEIDNMNDEDFRRLLRDHFTNTIEKLLESEESIENLSDAELKKYINDSQLVLISLRNRYPEMRIYKPQTTNAFLYERPRKHHYTSWETLNKGSKVEAKGSGGQLLAARTMIMMMIMTFRRQEHSTNWSVLITDNPFGQAVSAHILDPIFSIADILRFQWIVLAPPELIKLDVSRRFPVYWKLELSQQKNGEMIKEVLQHGGRTFDEVEFSLF